MGLTKNAGNITPEFLSLHYEEATETYSTQQCSLWYPRGNTICPGWATTPMVSAAIKGNSELAKMMKTIIPESRVANPEESAEVVIFMTSLQASYVTEVGWLVDGGTTLQVQPC
jgi:NAD(P)-dependent dehydrogenase (short-subunit alcohol dehydrogenase family)